LAKSPFLSEKNLLENLKKGDKSAFSLVFSTYYSDLVAFANTFTRQIPVSEEIVQDIFVKLWDEVRYKDITVSLKSYLLRSVQNRCIDWLRHMKVRDNYATMVLDNMVLFENNTENYIFFSELEQSLNKALNKLPEELAVTFKMNKLQGLKQTEIAEKLNISLRTVEYRLAKTLSILRDELKDFFVMSIFLIYSLFMSQY
jgi:RNA polymerase sigma-70 factor (ECF subfamily)